MRSLIPFTTQDGSPRVVATSFSPMTRLPWDVASFDRALSRFFDDPWGFGDLTRQEALRLEVDETPDEVLVRAEIPGIDPKDVELHLQGDVLTIAGEKKEATRASGTRSYSERRFGAFRREITLPFSVETDEVRAEVVNGVLSIRLPKAEAARPRKIEVRAG